MNIKGLVPTNVIVENIRPIERANKTIKSDEAHDRDPNGQQAFDNPNQEHKEPMSEEQFAKALEHLKNLPAIKEHKWTVEFEIDENLKKFAIVKDNLGNIIRKIPEAELWTLPDEDSPKGHLFKKSA